MRIHWLQHVPFEGLGSIGQWVKDRRHSVSCTRLYEGDPFPNAQDYDLLIVMGGPMGIYDRDRYPWLVDELRCIDAAVKAGKPIVGICLGAQMIASVFGAKVYTNKHKEIGWFPVTFTKEALAMACFEGFPEELTVFHWHGDTFDMPQGAVRIASSDACLNQGFVYDGRVFGFQFHMETTQQGAQALLDNCRADMTTGTYVQGKREILTGCGNVKKINSLISVFLGKLL